MKVGEPFAIGEILSRRGTARPANRMDGKFLLGGSPRILVLDWNDYADRGIHSFGTFIVYEPDHGKPEISGYLPIHFDVMLWMWMNVGKIIETTWGDEHFFHMVEKIGEHWVWRQWGSQGDADLELTNAETTYIVGELQKMDVRAPYLQTTYGPGEAKILDPEPWECFGGCRRCEKTLGEKCDADCRGRWPSTYVGPEQAIIDGRRYSAGSGLMPFEYGSNGIGSAFHLLSQRPVYTVRYYPDYPSARSSDFDDATLYIERYEHARHMGTFTIDVAALRKAAENRVISITDDSRAPVEVDFFRYNGEGIPGEITWDRQGVLFSASKHFPNEVGDLWVTWSLWYQLIDAAYEFKAWKHD